MRLEMVKLRRELVELFGTRFTFFQILCMYRLSVYFRDSSKAL